MRGATKVVVVVEVVVQEQDMNTHRQAGRQAGNDPNPSQPSEPRQDRRQE